MARSAAIPHDAERPSGHREVVKLIHQITQSTTVPDVLRIAAYNVGLILDSREFSGLTPCPPEPATLTKEEQLETEQAEARLIVEQTIKAVQNVLPLVDSPASKCRDALDKYRQCQSNGEPSLGCATRFVLCVASQLKALSDSRHDSPS